MDESFDSSPIRVIDPPLEWARKHAAFFFAEGVANAESMVEQLVSGANALGCRVELRAVGDWSIVGASEDWFARARFPIPENFNFQSLTPFPEWGQNSVRPECVIAAFARDVIVHGPSGTQVVKGVAGQSDPVFHKIAIATWQRAVAFRGVDAQPSAAGDAPPAARL